MVGRLCQNLFVFALRPAYRQCRRIALLLAISSVTQKNCTRTLRAWHSWPSWKRGRALKDRCRIDQKTVRARAGPKAKPKGLISLLPVAGKPLARALAVLNTLRAGGDRSELFSMEKDRTLLIIGLIVVLFVALAIWRGHRRMEPPPTASTEEPLKLAEICHAPRPFAVWSRSG